MGKQEITENDARNLQIGTSILAILKYEEEKGYAKYKDVYNEVIEGEFKSNDSKLKYYLKRLPHIIVSNKDGVYRINREELIKTMIKLFQDESVDYIEENYEDIFENKEVKKIILIYLISQAKQMENEDLYSLIDLTSNFETHLIVQYYEEKLKSKMLIKWAKNIIKEEKKHDYFKDIKWGEKNGTL